jgi:hypothetical protein
MDSNEVMSQKILPTMSISAFLLDLHFLAGNKRILKKKNYEMASSQG